MAPEAPAKTAPVLAPFRQGTQPTYKPAGYTQSNALGTTSIELPDYQIGPTNLIRGIDIEVSAIGVNATNSVAFGGDMPLGVLSTVNFQDSGGNSMVGSFDSYTLAMAMKYGGYAPGTMGDPRQSVVYSATTGTGSTAGSFNFVLRVPIEFIQRTGAGSLVNQTTQSPLTLSLTLTTLALVFPTTAPATSCTVTVTVDLLGYWKGSNAAANPAPAIAGSTQYWNRSSIMALNGAVDLYAPQTGFGNQFRTLVLMNYATGAARSTADFPSPFSMYYKGNLMFNRTKNQWQNEMSRWFGLTGATADTGPGLDTGVFVHPFATDFGKDVGAELMLSYLSTEVGDAIEYIGSWLGGSTLQWVLNYVSVNGVLEPGLI
jgi:hypothetical protein